MVLFQTNSVDNALNALDFAWFVVSLVAVWFTLHSIRLSYLSYYEEKILELRIRLLALRRNGLIDGVDHDHVLRALVSEKEHPKEVPEHRSRLYAGATMCMFSLFNKPDKLIPSEVHSSAKEDSAISSRDESFSKELKDILNEGRVAQILGVVVFAPIPALMISFWLLCIFLRFYSMFGSWDFSRVLQDVLRISHGDGKGPTPAPT